MSSLADLRYTPQEYYTIEQRDPWKNEFLNGVIRPMAHVNRYHCLIMGALICELGNQLRERPEQVYASRLRFSVPATGLYTYPDVVVVRGKSEYNPAIPDTLTNPAVIVEIVSPESEAYDRGEKFWHYRRFASLREYVLVAQDEPRVECFLRQNENGNQWIFSETRGLDATARLASLGCDLRLGEVYADVTFPSAGEETDRVR